MGDTEHVFAIIFVKKLKERCSDYCRTCNSNEKTQNRAAVKRKSIIRTIGLKVLNVSNVHTSMRKNYLQVL